MNNKYDLISYCIEDKIILENTQLTNDEKEIIHNLKSKYKDKLYFSVIEDIYKFYKNNYSTSDLSKIFKVSTRQMQNIFKELGINRNKLEAQEIIASRKNYENIRTSYKNILLEKLMKNQISGSSFEEYIRYELNSLLGSALRDCEIVIGINYLSLGNSIPHVPIIVIDHNYLYKYIIELEQSLSLKLTSSKKKEKNKSSIAFYKGYTTFKIHTSKDYNNKEIRDKLIEISNYIISEVSASTSIIKLE